MYIHNVKKPFMSEEGQYEKDKHTLCIGISVQALRGHKAYRVYIGSNKKDFYDITYTEALLAFNKYGEKMIWKNKKGNKVFIIPLKCFKHGEAKFSKKDFEKREKERDIAKQERLI